MSLSTSKPEGSPPSTPPPKKEISPWLGGLAMILIWGIPLFGFVSCCNVSAKGDFCAVPAAKALYARLDTVPAEAWQDEGDATVSLDEHVSISGTAAYDPNVTVDGRRMKFDSDQCDLKFQHLANRIIKQRGESAAAAFLKDN